MGFESHHSEGTRCDNACQFVKAFGGFATDRHAYRVIQIKLLYYETWVLGKAFLEFLCTMSKGLFRSCEKIARAASNPKESAGRVTELTSGCLKTENRQLRGKC